MRKCRVAGDDLVPLFSLGELHVSDFIPQGEEPNRDKYELKLMLSKTSGLVQLEHAPPLDLMYGKYWYRSGISNTMRAELKEIADTCIDAIHPVDGDVFLDIASNDGTLLSFVPDNIIKIGIDPVEGSFQDEAKKYADDTIQDYFTANAYKSGRYGNKKAKIITTIAMFYDLEDSESFLDDVNEILDDNGLFVLQLSYTPLMLQQLAFDNLCHEHICYYSLTSLKYLLDKRGFKILDCQLNDTNGGSFRIYIMKDKGDETKFMTHPYRDVARFRVESILEYERKLKLNEETIYLDFYSRICSLKDDTVSFIKREKEKGKTIYGYGASTKGNTLLQWYGLNETHIDAIAERSTFKYGLRTVGSNIPIVSEDSMREVQPDYLLILPWHFVNEFRQREKDYLERGGKFIVPCPTFYIVSARGEEHV